MWCSATDMVDTPFIGDVEKMPRQVRSEGLASQAFSISPEQSLGEYSVRNRTTWDWFFSCVSSIFWPSIAWLLPKPHDAFNYCRPDRSSGPSTKLPNCSPSTSNKHLPPSAPGRSAPAGGKNERQVGSNRAGWGWFPAWLRWPSDFLPPRRNAKAVDKCAKRPPHLILATRQRALPRASHRLRGRGDAWLGPPPGTPALRIHAYQLVRSWSFSLVPNNFCKFSPTMEASVWLGRRSNASG